MGVFVTIEIPDVGEEGAKPESKPTIRERIDYARDLLEMGKKTHCALNFLRKCETKLKKMKEHDLLEYVRDILSEHEHLTDLDITLEDEEF